MSSVSFKSETGTTPTLAYLPDLVLLNVANQLSNDDARSLSLTCMRFQGVLPIYKYAKVIRGPNIDESRPHKKRKGLNPPLDGHLPEIYFKCPILDQKVKKN